MTNSYYEEKVFTDNQGREVMELIYTGTFDLEDDVDKSQTPLGYKFVAIIAMPVLVGKMGVIPLVAIDRGRLPIPNAKTVVEAFELHDKIVKDAKDKIESEAKKPKIDVAQMGDLPPLKLAR